MRTIACLLALAAGCTFQPGAPKPIDDGVDATAPAPPDLAGRSSPADLAHPDLAPPPDLAPAPDLAVAVAGRWFQADREHCPDFCASMKMTSVPGPDLASCMSGEARSASAIQAGIRFTFGCWPDCSAQPAHAATTVPGGFCYAAGQNQDWDPTDRNVGCFCR